MQLFNQQQQGQNALRNLYSNPANLGPNGQPTPAAMATLFAASPSTAMDLRQSLMQDQQGQARVALLRTQEGEEVFRAKLQIGQTALAAYQAAKAAGASEPDARKAGTQALIDGKATLGMGLASPDAMSSMNTDFDPVRVQRNVAAGMAAQDAMMTPLQRAQMQRTNAATTLTQAQTAAVGPKTDLETAQAAKVRADTLTGGGLGPSREIRVDDGKGGTKVILGQQDKRGTWRDASTGNPLPSGAVKSIVQPGDPDSPSAAPLPHDALVYAAQIYREKGILPPVGFGQSGARMRQAIISEAARQAKAAHTDASGDILTQSDLKANQTALTNLGKMRANVASFEGTAKREADLALSLAPKGVAGGVPLFNRWIQAGRTELAGDPDVTSFNSALTSFKNEYARIMSSGTGTGGMTSDAARSESEGLINKAQTLDQLQQTIGTMQKSMQNRIDAINEEYYVTRHRIANAGKPGAENDKLPSSDAAPASKSAASPPASSIDGLPQVSSQQEYDAIPSGHNTPYRWPGDPPGMVRHKP